MLTALAYGRGAGLDDQRWLAFARALGYDGVASERSRGTEDQRRSRLPARNQHEPGGLVTRLFHQALADELVVSP